VGLTDGLEWESIYSNGGQLNKWPYSEVVSFFSRMYLTWGGNKKPRILEVGCGVGNNLWFLSDAGFEVSGIDYSSTAVEHARERLNGLGVEADLRAGDFKNLPFKDESFDFVLDRAALQHNFPDDLEQAVSEIHRVLVHGGTFFANQFPGAEHPDRLLGSEVAPKSFNHFSGGAFGNVGLTSFFSLADLEELFRDWNRATISRLRTDESGTLKGEHYEVVAIK